MAANADRGDHHCTRYWKNKIAPADIFPTLRFAAERDDQLTTLEAGKFYYDNQIF